jgi:hypothetical protein
MIDLMSTQMEALRESWSRTVASMVWGPWLMVDAGFQATQRVLAAAAPVTGGGTEGLIALAAERMKKGLSPPREIYLTPYRDQIDWAAFPDWARPTDPEAFEGCTHEG